MEETLAEACSSVRSETRQQGPDQEKLKVILERTGYRLDVTAGQRKYGGPPPGWEGTRPGRGCEVRTVKRFSNFNDGGVLFPHSLSHFFSGGC